MVFAYHVGLKYTLCLFPLTPTQYPLLNTKIKKISSDISRRDSIFKKHIQYFILLTHLFLHSNRIGISTFQTGQYPEDGCQGITGPNPSTFLHKSELVRTILLCAIYSIENGFSIEIFEIKEKSIRSHLFKIKKMELL